MFETTHKIQPSVVSTCFDPTIRWSNWCSTRRKCKIYVWNLPLPTIFFTYQPLFCLSTICNTINRYNEWFIMFKIFFTDQPLWTTTNHSPVFSPLHQLLSCYWRHLLPSYYYCCSSVSFLLPSLFIHQFMHILTSLFTRFFLVLPIWYTNGW